MVGAKFEWDSAEGQTTAMATQLPHVRYADNHPAQRGPLDLIDQGAALTRCRENETDAQMLAVETKMTFPTQIGTAFASYECQQVQSASLAR